MKPIFILLLILTIQNQVSAGDVQTESEILIQKGRYVTVSVLRGNPVRIFVANKQRAAISDDKITLEASSQNAPLKLSRSGEYYVVEQRPELGDSPIEVIEVRTRVKGSKEGPESFKFNFKNQ